MLKNITSNVYNVSSDDTFIKCNCSSNNINIILQNTSSKTITIQKNDDSFNAVTITPNTGTIDNETNYVLSNKDDYVTLILSSSNAWLIIDKNVQYTAKQKQFTPTME